MIDNNRNLQSLCFTVKSAQLLLPKSDPFPRNLLNCGIVMLHMFFLICKNVLVHRYLSLWPVFRSGIVSYSRLLSNIEAEYSFVIEQDGRAQARSFTASSWITAQLKLLLSDFQFEIREKNESQNLHPCCLVSRLFLRMSLKMDDIASSSQALYYILDVKSSWHLQLCHPFCRHICFSRSIAFS